MKIISARITPQPTSLFDPMPQVIATFQDGSTQALFSYYPDEISFHPSEFIGLTKEQALDLRRKKDITYLQS